MKDCLGGWRSPDATVATTPNDSNSSNCLLLDGGASAGEGVNTGEGGNAIEEAGVSSGHEEEKEEKMTNKEHQQAYHSRLRVMGQATPRTRM